MEKVNWGTKIVIALGLFVALITSFGIYMVTQDTDTLVHEDYYERGLNYDRLREADSLGVDIDSLPNK